MREFVELAFEHVGIGLRWEGGGVNEKGINKKTGEVVVEVDSNYFRPTEVEFLQGDASKMKTKLNWKPKTSFGDLVKEMVEYDLEAAKREKHIKDGGFNANSY